MKGAQDEAFEKAMYMWFTHRTCGFALVCHDKFVPVVVSYQKPIRNKI